ncbi:hypothetical protein CHUAL_004159 [Chamberlinius hualienensis]
MSTVFSFTYSAFCLLCYWTGCWIILITISQQLNGFVPCFGSAVMEDDCRQERLSNCIPKTSNFIDNQQLIFASSERELNNVCGTLNVAIECVEHYISMCYGPDKKELYEKMRDNSMGIIDDLCTNTTFRQEYLYHAKCLSNSSSAYNNSCKRSYMKFINESLTGVDPVMANPQLSLVKFCCAYNNFVSCINQQIRRQCQLSTVNFYHNFMAKSTGLVFKSHCSNFTVESSWCSSANNFGVSHLILLMVIKFYLIIAMI